MSDQSTKEVWIILLAVLLSFIIGIGICVLLPEETIDAVMKKVVVFLIFFMIIGFPIGLATLSWSCSWDENDE